VWIGYLRSLKVIYFCVGKNRRRTIRLIILALILKVLKIKRQNALKSTFPPFSLIWHRSPLKSLECPHDFMLPATRASLHFLRTMYVRLYSHSPDWLRWIRVSPTQVFLGSFKVIQCHWFLCWSKALAYGATCSWWSVASFVLSCTVSRYSNLETKIATFLLPHSHLTLCSGRTLPIYWMDFV